MAVTYATGFEAQQAATDNVTLNGTASISTAQHRTGAASLRCNPASSASGYAATGNIGGGFIHFGLYIASQPSVDRYIFGDATNCAVKLTSAGHLAFYNSGTLAVTGSAALQTGVWYWIGVRLWSGTGVVLIQVDGVDDATGNGSNGLHSGKIGFSGTEASAGDIYIDDVILVTTGDGFLAPSKVDIALPISDSQRAFVTTGDGSGTTNLWDAVNNVPPAGLASASETTTSNIEFPANTASQAFYEPNLETYTTLGIASGDTVLAVQSIVRHGEDIATGTKTLASIATDNPSHAEASAFTFGNDGGAHGAEPGLWVTKFGDLQTSPSVTLGSSPQILLTRNASEARVGCVDFMGLLVVWTPAAVAQVPYFNPMPPLLAQ